MNKDYPGWNAVAERKHRWCDFIDPVREGEAKVPSQVGDFFHAWPVYFFALKQKLQGLPQSLKINENPEIRKIYPNKLWLWFWKLSAYKNDNNYLQAILLKYYFLRWQNSK